MIIKNITTKGSGALIKYLLRYALNEEKQAPSRDLNTALVMKHNIKSRSIKGYIREYKENESKRIYKRKDQVAAHHTIISWNALDASKITNKTLRAIAKEFIKLRGFNNLFICAEHKDRAHKHLHFCISGSRLDGRSSSLTKDQFAKLKTKMDEFQRTHFPELIHSLPDHGRAKKQQVHLKALPDLRSGVRPIQKDLLAYALEQAYINSNSLKEFVDALRSQGHEPYYRGEKKNLTGITSGMRKFRFRTLGYDQQKLAVLDDRKLMHHELSELQSIRARSKESERSREDEEDHVRGLEMVEERTENEVTSVPSFADSFEGFGVLPQKSVLHGT